MTKEYYIMSFVEAIESAEKLLQDGYDVEIRRVGADSARVFAVRKKKISRTDESDRE